LTQGNIAVQWNPQLRTCEDITSPLN